MNKERVLVLGRGFLGKQFGKNGYRVIGRECFDFSHELHYADLSSFSILRDTDSYDAIINTIGKSSTRWCEDPQNWRELFKVNSELPLLLSDHCRRYDKKLVHISSGCVYDDNTRPQKETDSVSSHCKYVVSKLAGEYGCDTNRDLILRPRLYFGEDVDKNNLLHKMRSFSKFLGEINSYASVQTIVEATHALLHNECVGVFNVACVGYTSLYHIANNIGFGDVERMDVSELHKQEGIHLVNNILDTSKLEKYYPPREIYAEIRRCWDSLTN